MHRSVIVPNPTFIDKNQGTFFKQPVIDVLEEFFQKEKWPSDKEIAILAESLKLEKKLLRLWFRNRRENSKNYWTKQKSIEKSVQRDLERYYKKHETPSLEEMASLAVSLQLDHFEVGEWFKYRRQKEKRKKMSPGKETENYKQKLPTQCTKKRIYKRNNHKTVDVIHFPLNLSAGQIYGNTKRYTLGKPNGTTQHRTVLILGSRELIHKKFVNEIINYIVNVKEDDQFRFQLAEEEGQSNCISVYDIHHAEGFRIPHSLTIVVTPYSADWEDSGQLLNDQKVSEMFRELIEAKDGIKELDMICNMTVKTGKAKPPFLSIFGKDVQENINNWDLVKDFLRDQAPWHAVVQHFFSVLTKMKPKSLLLTQLVLNERKILKETVDRIQYLSSVALAKMEKINNTKQEMRNFQEQIRMNYNSLFAVLTMTDVPALLPISPGPSNQLENVNNRDRSHLSEEINRMCQEAEINYYEVESKGKLLIELLHKELLENGSVMKMNIDQTWLCIQQLNRIALHGHSFLNPKLFHMILHAENHLTKLICLKAKV